MRGELGGRGGHATIALTRHLRLGTHRCAILVVLDVNNLAVVVSHRVRNALEGLLL